MHQQLRNPQFKLFEGLRAGDLKDMVSNRVTIDQYKSKMGEDKSIAVLAFKVKDKFPAIDLMEFIEKGYNFVLDADMSSGEEKDGEYRVFVEFERSPELPNQLEKLLTGVGRLCDCPEWRFKYWKDLEGHTFTKEAVSQFVPLTAEDYQTKVDSQTKTEVETVLDQGPTEVIGVDESKNITLRRPFSGDLKIKLEAIGQYDDIKQLLVGGLQLDESSNSQILYLEKYLGNYEINKIDGKFLIRNGNKGLVIKKDRW